jgi:hypothetical protein
MDINSVSQLESGFLVNGAIHVPNDDSNRHYLAVLAWIDAGGEVETEDTSARDADVVREERNRLLTACDWTQLADCALDADVKSAWVTYRQALRDVPEQAGFPASVTWPRAPGAEAN